MPSLLIINNLLQAKASSLHYFPVVVNRSFPLRNTAATGQCLLFGGKLASYMFSSLYFAVLI